MRVSRATKRYPVIRQGSAALVLVVMLFVSLIVSAFVINTAYMEFIRTELQITTDLATRAACREYVKSADPRSALLKAQQIAAENPVASRVLSIHESDLSFKVATRYEESEAYEYLTRQQNSNSVTFVSSYFERTSTGIEPLLPFLDKVSFRPTKHATAIQAELDLAIVLDCSTSMLAPSNESSGIESPLNLPIFQPSRNSRWAIAKSGILELIDQCRASQHRENIGLAMFGTVALHGTKLSEHHGFVEAQLAMLDSAYIGGFTNLGDGILAGIGMLSDQQTARAWSSRAMLVISDGMTNFGPSAVQAADQAAAEFVTIYTVSLSNEANVELMYELASRTRGHHFHVESPEQFREVILLIADRLPVLISK